VALDTLLKKYFSVMVLGLIAMAAYFEASGAMQLVGSSLGANESVLAAAPAALPGAELPPPKPKSGEPILARNPFDSVTGPLNAKPIDMPGQSAPDLSNPLEAPACEGVRVNIVTEAPDPTWSLAAIQGPGEQTPEVRRVGDKVGSDEILYIGFNPVQQSPSVWMSNGPTICQAVLFTKQPEASAPAPSVLPMPHHGRGAAGVPEDIASKIQKVSDTEFNVDRGVVDKILANQAELMRSARIVPEQQNGKVVGIRLFGIRPNTLLGTLGLQSGDRLESINGFDMTSPEKALQAYARLQTASSLDVKINRRGNPMDIEYNIK
jgi:general secretion pathway protein C